MENFAFSKYQNVPYHESFSQMGELKTDYGYQSENKNGNSCLEYSDVYQNYRYSNYPINSYKNTNEHLKVDLPSSNLIFSPYSYYQNESCAYKNSNQNQNTNPNQNFNFNNLPLKNCAKEAKINFDNYIVPQKIWNCEKYTCDKTQKRLKAIKRQHSSLSPNENSDDSKSFKTTNKYRKVQTPSVIRRNERERNRVRAVNQGFTNLRQHVPEEYRDKKLSKMDTLRAAIDYLRHLYETLECSDGEKSKICSNYSSQNDTSVDPLSILVDKNTSCPDSNVSINNDTSSNDSTSTIESLEMLDNENFNFNDNPLNSVISFDDYFIERKDIQLNTKP
ncbi:Achaete-scute [Intoshia linei]|uniref:Achaete-scute n=1 Tax=Intoshia linei TaxID=1819745 RepID=A0A177BA52_9BILA|nr:Achaete-scute [Intoshia linei]